MVKKRKAKSRFFKDIGGWLIPVLLLLAYSAISASYLLIQRIIAIINNTAGTGVYISVSFLVVYLASVLMTIIFIFMRKKKAVKAFIAAFISGTVFSLWYFLIGQIIYYPGSMRAILAYGIPMILFNLALDLVVLFYLLKS